MTQRGRDGAPPKTPLKKLFEKSFLRIFKNFYKASPVRVMPDFAYKKQKSAQLSHSAAVRFCPLGNAYGCRTVVFSYSVIILSHFWSFVNTLPKKHPLACHLERRKHHKLVFSQPKPDLGEGDRNAVGSRKGTDRSNNSLNCLFSLLKNHPKF